MVAENIQYVFSDICELYGLMTSELKRQRIEIKSELEMLGRRQCSGFML